MTITPEHAPYGTPEAPRIAVRGEVRLEVEPEIARMDITVSAHGTDRRSALEDLTRRNTAVLDLVKSYGRALEKVETGTVAITPQRNEKSRGERIRAYHGRVQVAATLCDFTAVGELATRLADLELTSVEGPWWALRTDSPVYRDARRQAVLEAVQRARDYAGALGAELVALLEIADTGAENAATLRPPMGAARAGYGAAAGGPAPALDLEPQRQSIHAHVNARFTMSPPRL